MVEEMLAVRGIEVSHETVRKWGLKFGREIANGIRRRRPQGGDKWHLDEMVVTIAGRKHLSLSRLNHWLPRGQADPEVMQGTADFHHDITDALPPQADAVFDDATALDAAVDMLDPQPAGVERLVGSLLRR